jgi:hypothetical protein
MKAEELCLIQFKAGNFQKGGGRGRASLRGNNKPTKEGSNWL